MAIISDFEEEEEKQPEAKPSASSSEKARAEVALSAATAPRAAGVARMMGETSVEALDSEEEEGVGPSGRKEEEEEGEGRRHRSLLGPLLPFSPPDATTPAPPISMFLDPLLRREFAAVLDPSALIGFIEEASSLWPKEQIQDVATGSGVPTRTKLIISLSVIFGISLFGAGISVCVLSKWREKFRKMTISRLFRHSSFAVICLLSMPWQEEHKFRLPRATSQSRHLRLALMV
ncbi:hypothetical protein NL676_008747 [Syzygium grande]|nr:hypothetical protein NL676_008747 [Syzygium grande]